MPKAIRIAAILLLALAVVLMVLAFGISRRSTPAPTAAVSAPAPSLPKRMVVVATKAIPAGQPISGSDLSTTEMALPPSEGFSNIADVSGRTPAMDIAAGAMITPQQLLQGIALGIRPGERALAVPVDEIAGVSNRVTPGDYVDVFMSLQNPSSAGSGQDNTTQARLLLSRLRVLGYGSNDVAQPHPGTASEGENTLPPEPGSRAETIASRSRTTSSNNSDAPQARSAILAVPVEDAGRLLLAAHSGKLFLALRNPGDTGLADASLFTTPAPVLALRRDLDAAGEEAAVRPENRAYAGIDLDALAGTRNRATAPAPTTPQRSRAPRQPSRQGIEIIRGTTPSNRLSSP